MNGTLNMTDIEDLKAELIKQREAIASLAPLPQMLTMIAESVKRLEHQVHDTMAKQTDRLHQVDMRLTRVEADGQARRTAGEVAKAGFYRQLGAILGVLGFLTALVLAADKLL